MKKTLWHVSLKSNNTDEVTFGWLTEEQIERVRELIQQMENENEEVPANLRHRED